MIICAAWLNVRIRRDGSVVARPLGRLLITCSFKACRSAIWVEAASSLAPALRSELLSGMKLPRVTSRTITSRAALEADLEQGRARGWYVTRGETVADLMAVAVPVEVNGETYSVALAGPMNRMDGALKRHAKLLTDLRMALERES